MKSIIESLEARWFMASMTTGAMGIFTFLIFKVISIIFLKYLALFFIALSFGIFILFAILTIIRIFTFPKSVILDIKHPVASNFFAGISISAGILSTSLSNVVIPLQIFSPSIASQIAFYLYVIAIILGLFFLAMVSFQLISSEKTKSEHALGIWLLPPVGIFVSIFSGNFVAPHLSIETGTQILLINLFLFGIAFWGYIYTMALIFQRIKFHPLPPSSMAPSFLIPLAPVGVSIIALWSLQKGFLGIPQMENIASTLSSFFLIYAPFIIGFGFFWVISSTLVIQHYIKTQKIPFSLGFWAFVFPIDAFGIGIILTSKVFPFMFLEKIAIGIWSISIILWIFVFLKTIQSAINGKAFERPKEVK